jgi:hypothetical protein
MILGLDLPQYYFMIALFLLFGCIWVTLFMTLHFIFYKTTLKHMISTLQHEEEEQETCYIISK